MSVFDIGALAAATDAEVVETPHVRQDTVLFGSFVQPSVFVDLHDESLTGADETPTEAAAGPDEDLPSIRTNSYTFLMSREMALDYGLVEPTPEEAAERAQQAVEHRRRRAAAWEVYDAAQAALTALPDTIARSVLSLHGPVFDGASVVCKGCDLNGMESEPPDWPCSTTQHIATAYDVLLPDPWLLSLDYEPETRTWQRP